MKAIWFLALAGLLTACPNTSTQPTAPENPSGFTATAASATSVTLSWTSVTGATGYTLERKTDATAYGKIADVGASVTTYTDAELMAGTAHTYRLKTVGAGGSSSGVEQTAVMAVLT